MARLEFGLAIVSILVVVVVHVESRRFGRPALGMDYVDSYVRSYEDDDADRAHRSRPTGRPTTSLGKSCSRPSWRSLVDNEPVVPCNTKHPSCRFRRTCGLAPLNPLTGPHRPYIIFGQDQKYGEWPSFVKVLTRDRDNRTVLCGGVLVSDRHVLTAAHCLRVGKPTSVVVGDHRRKYLDEFEKKLSAKSSCRAREFAWNKVYDWALITLKEPVEFNDHVQPACLPFEPIDRTETGLCYVVGAGLADYHNYLPEVVQRMRVKRTHCVKSTSDLSKIQECYSAAASNPNSEIFFGDSGSPVLCLDRNKRWTVTGLVRGGCNIHYHQPQVGEYTKLRTQLKNIKAQCNF
jgi:hypothetical protein